MKKYYSITITIILIGFALFIAQSKVCSIDSTWYSIIGNIASAILICGLISLLDHILLKQEEEKRLLDLFNISRAIKDSGLTNILADSGEYHYRDLLLKSNSFSAILNDGRRWVGNHQDALEKRFNKKGTETEFFLVDPDGSFCKALDTKTHTDGHDAPHEKIRTTVSILKSTYQKSQKLGSLTIYYLKNYPTQTLFFTEDTIIVTPYQTSSRRTTIPLYEYKYTPSTKSVASHMYEDLEFVRKESRVVYNSK